MKYKLYQIDAFADKVFAGNPAAVCPLEHWLSDDILQKIAMENNLAETAFYVKDGDQYQLRWFTPTVEIDLCGHATLAAAYVLFYHENYKGDTIHFHSHRSGDLPVTKNGDFLTLNFPTDHLEPIQVSLAMIDCFGKKPLSAFKGRSDYLLLFDKEADIRAISPSFEAVASLDARGVIISAKGEEVDFVSRFFGPRVGINEDPVTGSAHTTLIPYWAEQLGKQDLTAMQLSARTGFLKCRLLGDRVEISGQCRLYLIGEIYLD